MKGEIIMKNRNWKKWAVAAGIRAIRTFAQTFASLMTVGAVLSEIDWGYIASASAVAGIYSIATSVAGLPEVTAEVTDTEGDA